MSALELEGIVETGLGEGSRFTALPWAQREFARKLGFEPYPGTFNLRLGGPDWVFVTQTLARENGIPIDPPNGFCRARCFRVELEGEWPGYVVIPEVAGYPEGKLEILSPLALRAVLEARDGDRVAVRLLLED